MSVSNESNKRKTGNSATLKQPLISTFLTLFYITNTTIRSSVKKKDSFGMKAMCDFRYSEYKYSLAIYHEQFTGFTISVNAHNFDQKIRNSEILYPIDIFIDLFQRLCKYKKAINKTALTERSEIEWRE